VRRQGRANHGEGNEGGSHLRKRPSARCFKGDESIHAYYKNLKKKKKKMNVAWKRGRMKNGEKERGRSEKSSQNLRNELEKQAAANGTEDSANTKAELSI